MLKNLKLTDYIIITFVIAALVFAGVRIFKKKGFENLPAEKEADIMFEVIFRGISLSAPEFPFKPGGDAFITIRNVPYKKLKINAADGSLRMTYAPSNAKGSKGYEAVPDVSAPRLFDFIVRLEDKAKKTPDGWVTGGNKIKMGMPVIIEGELYRYQGTISNIFEASIQTQNQEDNAE